MAWRTAGFDVQKWPDGESFLKGVAREVASCVLLDVRMPGMDGLQVQAAMVENGINFPVIVLTGHGDISTAVQAMRAGAVDFLEKPFERERLLGSIEPDLKLLHLCGVDRRGSDGARQTITEIPVYRSEPIDDVELSDVDAALIHSPRAGMRLAELTPDKSAMTIIAISQAAADAAGDGWRAVKVADQPTDEALLALAARLCNKPRP